MKRTLHTPEQVIKKLREADAMLSSGRSMAKVLQHLGVSEQTFNRWRNEYGGMNSEEARRLKGLEVEKARLKRLVAKKDLDISIVREANEHLGKPQAPRGGGRSCATSRACSDAGRGRPVRCSASTGRSSGTSGA
jgi:putative transposase